MAQQDIHEPQLPGVKTLANDAKKETLDDESLGISFFHREKEPEMKAPTAPAFSEPKSSVLTNSGDVFNVSKAYDDGSIETGTIVTDRRQKRNSVGTLFKAALNEWWGDTSASLKKIELIKKVEHPTVVKAEERKEIIAEAAQFTRQAPRDDHAVVVEKIKTLSHDAERVTGKPYIIKKPAQTESPSWSKDSEAPQPAQKSEGPKAHTRTATLDLRSVVVAPVVQKHTQTDISTYTESRVPSKVGSDPIRVPSVSTTAPAHSPKKADAPEKGGWKFFAQIRDERPHNATPITPKIAPLTPHVEHTPAPTHTPPAQREIPKPAPVVVERPPVAPPPLAVPLERVPPPPPPPTPPTPRIEPVTPRAQDVPRAPHILTPELRPEKKSPRTTRSLIPAIVLVTVITLGAVGGVLTGIYVSKERPASEGTEQVVIGAQYLRADRSLPVTLGTSKTAFIQALTREIEGSTNGVTQLYPVHSTPDSLSSTPATNTEIVDTLELRLSGSFLRALEEGIMLGGVNAGTNEPFMVLRSFTFDTAFAGMLDWEPFMAADLEPLFGTAPTTPRFVDALTQNRSIRILYDEAGNEHIIYAFVNRDTIVITTSTSALSALLERL